MKKFIIAALLMVSTPAYAAPSELCPKMGELAGTIMKARQSGMSKSAILSVLIQGSVYNLSVSMVNLAYVYPVYPTQSMKATAIENFQMQTEYLCYENNTN